MTIKNHTPCKTHSLSFPNKDMPESKNITLYRCNSCGWFVKDNRDRSWYTHQVYDPFGAEADDYGYVHLDTQ